MTAPLVVARNVVKSYQALRPLRLQSLTLSPGAIVALTGLDAQAAEVLVGLLTGALLPEEGEVELFGRSTRSVTDSDAWLAMLDRVGLLTDRAVLIGSFTAAQNIAMPFTLQVDPLADEVRARVEALAAEVGLRGGDIARQVAEAPAEVVTRVRLARALALNPTLLLAEHPSAALPRDRVTAFAGDMARIARRRGLAVLAVTADDVFARALGGDVLRHEPASGALRARSRWRKIFG